MTVTLILPIFVLACSGKNETTIEITQDINQDINQDTNEPSAESGLDTEDSGDSDIPTPLVWEQFRHPCLGAHTDAMWFDDEQNGFVGCGSTLEGKGLYQTQNRGQMWTRVLDPNHILEEMRITSLQRALGSHLYIGGSGPNGVRVLFLDAANTIQEFFSLPISDVEPWQTFHVGSFRKATDGRGVSAPLNGVDLIYWPSNDLSVFSSGNDWWSNTSIQGTDAKLLDLDVYRERFYAVGSTTAQLPYFFYEHSDGMGDIFGLQALELPTTDAPFIGEVRDIDIDDLGNMVLSGVNQNNATAVLWYNQTDAFETQEDWTMVAVSPLLPDPMQETQFHGGCRKGDLIVSVGGYSERSNSLVIFSKDGGRAWNYKEPMYGTLSNCQIIDSKVYITGADGVFVIFNPYLND